MGGFSFPGGFALTSGGTPSGSAGGDLGGTYPNPTVVSVAHVTNGVLAAANGGTGTANTGALAWNAAQTFSFTSGQTMTFPAASTTIAGLGTAQTFSAAQTFSVAGAASTPGVLISGAPFTGGSGTTTLPQLYLNSGTAPTTWSTSGTVFGINAPNGFVGNLVSFYVNGGSSLFSINNIGAVTAASSVTASSLVSLGNTVAAASSILGWNGRTNLTSPSTNVMALGGADAASPAAFTARAQDVAAGTSNGAGVNLTVAAGVSTGSGTSGDLVFQTGGTGAGTTAKNSLVTSLTIKGATQAVVVASGKTFQIGNAATTGLSAGALAATTNASIVITDSTGQAYRIPCII